MNKYKNIKSLVKKYVMMQKWAFRMWEWYLYGSEKTKVVRLLCCAIILPFSIVTYPFARIKPDRTGIYKICKDNMQFCFYVPDYKTDIMQRYFLLTDDFHDHCLIYQFTKEILSPGMVVLDVGGNVGNHTIFWATHADPQCVHTFEPNKHTFDILSKNIELNKLENKVILHNCAVGEKAGVCDSVVTDSDNSGENQVKVNMSGTIPVVSIDELDLPKIDFVKIDVEGFEYEVLKGAKESLKKFQPIILVEIFKENFEKVDSLIKSYGYVRKEYMPLNNRNDYLYIFPQK